MEELLMKFVDDDMNDILILSNDEQDIYVINLTQYSVSNYSPMGSMADVFELINCEEDIIINQKHKDSLMECLNDYEEMLDTERFKRLSNLLKNK